MAKTLRSAQHRALIAVVRKRRAALGLSQRAFAERAKLSYYIVWKTEAGERNLGFLEFPKYAEALGMTRQAFVEAVFGKE
jgi:transcriptional regulator with XRE-family HTH domain